jgi:3-deoxy-D-manno-octulosonate cytidylyltransferase
MKFIGLIPARYASTRFPGKPLANLCGRPVIQWVYETVAQCLDEAYVCTDDERIMQAVEAFGGKAVMTSTAHRSGTDRCYEAYQKVGQGADVVVNIQGDEPFIHPTQLQTIRACFENADTQIATLVKPFRPEDGLEALRNPNSPKVVVDNQILLEQMAAIKGRIKATLAKALHNGNITLSMRVAEATELKKVLSRKELFEEMRTRNQSVEKLSKLLKLELT